MNGATVVNSSENRVAPRRIAVYLCVLAGVTMAALATIALQRWLAPSVSILFFPVVVAAGLFGGYGPALFGTVLSTFALAYFIVTPVYSLTFNVDDLIRLAVFAIVALLTASISSARKRTADALRQSVDHLRSLHATMERLREWPRTIEADTAAALQAVLRRARDVIGSNDVAVAWEDDEEPLAKVARLGEPVTHCAPDAIAGFDAVQPPDAATVLCARFRTQHLSGCVRFTGVPPSSHDIVPTVDLVAREVGSSLEQIRVADRLQLLAIRNERIRVAQDLHDGMLQALAGVRFELQTVRRTETFSDTGRQRLDLVDDVLGREQKDLRRLIDESRLGAMPARGGRRTAVTALLEDVVARLRVDWRTLITPRVTPPDLAVPAALERPLQLMVHEGVVNALKHGDPSRVTVDAAQCSGGLRLVISDDGRGFSFRGRLDHATLAARQLGPASLRDRVAAMGGTIAVDSGEDLTRIELTLPIEHDAEVTQ